MAAGASAADQMDAAFRKIIDNDPEIQAVIRGVWGNATRDERPSDTPKNLEKRNAAASKQIEQILQRKGISLPDRTFINPRSGTIEGHRGWAGLSGLQKAAILSAAGVATGGALAAGGAFGGLAGGAGAGGGGAAAGAAGPSMIMPAMATSLSPATLAGLGGGTAATVGGAAAGGGGLLAGLGKALGTKQGIGRLAEGVGAVAGGIGKSAAQDRQAGIDYGLLRDRLGLDASQTDESNRVNRADLELRQNQDQRTDLNNAFQKSLQANLIQSWPGAPSMPSRIPTFNLGATGPTPGARDMAGSMASQMRGVVDQGGRRGTALPAYSPYTLASPTERPGASTTERVADILGLGGTALSGLLNPPNQQNQASNLEQWLKILGDRA
jgi:hypothetical protein